MVGLRRLPCGECTCLETNENEPEESAQGHLANCWPKYPNLANCLFLLSSTYPFENLGSSHFLSKEYFLQVSYADHISLPSYTFC